MKTVALVIFGLILVSINASALRKQYYTNLNQYSAGSQAAEASAYQNTLAYNNLNYLPSYGGWGLGGGIGGYYPGNYWGGAGLGLGGLDATNFYSSQTAAQAAEASSYQNGLSYTNYASPLGYGYGYPGWY